MPVSHGQSTVTGIAASGGFHHFSWSYFWTLPSFRQGIFQIRSSGHIQSGLHYYIQTKKWKQIDSCKWRHIVVLHKHCAVFSFSVWSHFKFIMCYQGSLRKMTALWRRRSESCDDPILKIWRGETLHCAMPSTSVRKALRTLLRIRWLSASRRRKWLLGTSSREPTTTFVTSVCGSPSYGAWEFLYVTVSCCLSGETGLIFHSSDDINSSRMHSIDQQWNIFNIAFLHILFF